MKTIEHKIVTEKDYTGPSIFGTFWVFICFGTSYAMWYLFAKLIEADIIFATVIATASFFFGIYIGRDTFQAEEREKVIHIIKNKKEGTK